MRFSDRIVVGLSSDYPRIVFILAEAIQRVSAAILNSKISWVLGGHFLLSYFSYAYTKDI